MNLHLPFLAVFLLCSISATAQSGKVFSTLDNQERLLQIIPDLLQSQQTAEDSIAAGIATLTAFEAKSIPVVFHILQNPFQTTVTEAQVRAQLAALNRDFSAVDESFSHPSMDKDRIREKVANPQVRFCLPELIDPLSLAINFSPTLIEEWALDDAMKLPALGGLPAWDSDRYLNVWVVNLAEGSSGYAQLPGGPASTDGIVIDHEFFGTGGSARPGIDQGKTLTHLVGNYLGLKPLWGEIPCGDDGIYDTPRHNTPTIHCPTTYHVSTCDGNPMEMFMNFMDSTPDECQSMFTLGQKVRMHAVLGENGPRGLLNTTLLQCDAADDVVEHLSLETIGDQLPDPSVKLFPNPATNMVQVLIADVAADPLTVELLDQLGRPVLRRPNLDPGSGTIALDLNGFQNGTYTVVVAQNGHLITQSRLIISR